MKNDLIPFEDYKIRRPYDKATEAWYFSIVDIIQVLTQQPVFQTARNYWKVLKNRLNKEGSIGKFLPSSLNRKVFLSVSNFWFSSVYILSDKITGKARKMIIFNKLRRTFASGDRFASAGKVMVGIISRLLARFYGLLDSVFESPPLGIPKARL